LECGGCDGDCGRYFLVAYGKIQKLMRCCCLPWSGTDCTVQGLLAFEEQHATQTGRRTTVPERTENGGSWESAWNGMETQFLALFEEICSQRNGFDETHDTTRLMRLGLTQWILWAVVIGHLYTYLSYTYSTGWMYSLSGVGTDHHYGMGSTEYGWFRYRDCTATVQYSVSPYRTGVLPYTSSASLSTDWQGWLDMPRCGNGLEVDMQR
jgi:hypothetical protein